MAGRLVRTALGLTLLGLLGGFTYSEAGGRPAPSAGEWLSPEQFGPVLGASGPVRTFRIAVEAGLPLYLADFTALVEATLGDPRGWTADGSVRLQRVPAWARIDVTIYLASADNAARLCGAGGVDIRIGGVPYTSCRAGENVVVNAARYLDGVPNYGAPLSDYRRYVINHEMGHFLGHGHEDCPGAGQLSPVMAQQTLGLAGCLPNSWPFPRQ
jgi:hypothetical protein